MSSFLIGNLLLFLSACGSVTSDHIRTPIRRQVQANQDDELYLPDLNIMPLPDDHDDSPKTWLFGAGDSSEWGATSTNDETANSTTEMNHHRPTLINISALDQGEYVTDTSAGTLHSTVVTSQGRILTASSVAIQTSGIGRDTVDGSQLDFQPITEVYYLDDNTPSTPPVFSKVVASQYYTMALDISGNVWATGTNTYGQLCLGDAISRDRFYQVAKAADAAAADAAAASSKVVDIALGERHTLLLMDNGQVFGCGWNAYGQLGIGVKGTNMLEPVEILIDEPDFNNTTTDTPIVANITQIAAGRGSSYFLTSSDHVYATGTNYEGQLCLGDRVDRPLPTMLMEVEQMQSNRGNDFSFNDEGVVVNLIAAGKSSFYMLLSNGQVVACGKNTHGQLGNENINNTEIVSASDVASDVPAMVTALANVTDIFATAISFTAFFLQDYGVYGVGQDGSGQIGNGALQWNPLSEVSCPENERAFVGQQNIIISSGNDHTLFLVNTDGIFDCEGQGGSNNNNNSTDVSSLAPSSSMSPTSSIAPTITAGPSWYYPTTPSPQLNSSLAPTPTPSITGTPTQSPVQEDRNQPGANQPSGGAKVNGMMMEVFCLGIAFAVWQFM
eukprot:CAMPEP_0201690682 /NCGR_PEP_ID=MMETSP0578-20130828/4057_1 /ASSEMBLY_ACC=CAM_ASM_000663 /TAXON_ID=267565 /ORGANISM="Skeletonema grethea, Strain CCMP 1804" /LENGTH=613 /DNA_ID=CAMNT_0048175729 /DNA_START=128 /DNA_END=1969 /DNA_ORIENTATION=-